MLDGTPCHHRMARPRVVDGRDGLQYWRLAANILNKQPQTNDKGRSSSLGVGLTTPHRKKNKQVTKMLLEPRTWADSLEQPKRVQVESSCKLDNEPSGSINAGNLPSGCTTCGL
jgi:hypothetical protein